MASLLPPLLDNQRWQVLEQLLLRLDALDRSSPITLLVDVTHESVLDHLADQFSLFDDGWDLAQTSIAKRALLKQAIEIHRYKGTVWAVKETLRVLGLADSVLIERDHYNQHNNTITHDGNQVYGFVGSWTHYRVIVQLPITRRQATLIRKVLGNVAPARCLLIALDYTDIPLLHNGQIFHDAEYAHGVA